MSGHQMKNDYFSAIKNGVQFLNSKQLDSGAFNINQWISINDKSNDQKIDFPCGNISSVFGTSFILHSLNFTKFYIDDKQIDKIVKPAISFLIEEKEEYGLWRFYGKNSGIPFDIDCTCCVLAALFEWKNKIDFEINFEKIASYLLKNRNRECIFQTWFLNENSGHLTEKEVDWVVNANALFFYSLLNQNLPSIEKYLLKIVNNNFFKKTSNYYQPISGIYFLTRTYADGYNHRLEPAIETIKNYILENESKFVNNDLSLALYILALENCAADRSLINRLSRLLINNQKDNGQWSKHVFFSTKDKRYHEFVLKWGSQELTTAFALEALSKSLLSHSYK
jgi:hypothetical protein